MKMKKTVCALLAVILLCASAFCFGACATEPKKPTVAIIQFGSHASLNNCCDGIRAGLASELDLDQYNVEIVNSNFDTVTSQSQAKKFVRSDAAVIIAIATPSAIAAATASDGKIPVVFCAVTDATVMKNFGNVTGSSDIPDFDKQLEVVTAFMGKEALKIGVLYSSEESSSPIQVENLKKAAGKYTGMEIKDRLVTDITAIDTHVNALLNDGVDCLLNLLDNTVVGKLESNILPITNEKKIPVFGSEIEQVRVGCVASASIDYHDVGAAAGKAAAKILGGTKADDIPVATVTEPTICFNSAACASLGLTVPALTATDVAEK